jgi:hypothetical protein
LFRALGHDECSAVYKGAANEFKHFGIGKLRTKSGDNPMSWFHLYPRKNDNTGWLYYKNFDNDHSGIKLTIHSIEKGDNHDGFRIDNTLCWAKLVQIIRSSKTISHIETFRSRAKLMSFFLGNTEDVDIIGTVDVITE